MAEIDGRVVGFAAHGPCADEGSSPGDHELESLYLLPEVWSLGLGRQLLQAAREAMVLGGAQQVSLRVLSGNTRAIRFYRVAGFSEEPNAVRTISRGDDRAPRAAQPALPARRTWQHVASGRRPTARKIAMTLDEHDFKRLQELEESLWREHTRFDTAWMRTVLAEDFREVGMSGRLYDLDSILSLAPGPLLAVIPLPDFAARLLAIDVAQLTYTSAVRRGDAWVHARRSSIWSRRADGTWVLRFHQGTPVPVP